MNSLNNGYNNFEGKTEHHKYLNPWQIIPAVEIRPHPLKVDDKLTGVQVIAPILSREKLKRGYWKMRSKKFTFNSFYS